MEDKKEYEKEMDFYRSGICTCNDPDRMQRQCGSQYSAAKQPGADEGADTDDPYGGGTGSGVKSSGY